MDPPRQRLLSRLQEELLAGVQQPGPGEREVDGGVGVELGPACPASLPPARDQRECPDGDSREVHQDRLHGDGPGRISGDLYQFLSPHSWLPPGLLAEEERPGGESPHHQPPGLQPRQQAGRQLRAGPGELGPGDPVSPGEGQRQLSVSGNNEECQGNVPPGGNEARHHPSGGPLQPLLLVFRSIHILRPR